MLYCSLSILDLEDNSQSVMFFVHHFKMLKQRAYLLLQRLVQLNDLTLFGLGFLGLLRPGGIFSSPLPNFCYRSDNDLKLCGKVVYHEKVPKNFFGVDDVSIFIDFVCCQLLVIF